MVNGPPTPPAITPTELHDEARVMPTVLLDTDSSSAPPPSALITSHTIPESYRNAIPLISEAISRNDYTELINIAERTDTNSANDRHQSRLSVISPLVLSHLILDDLPAALYALLRLPENLAFLPVTKAFSALVTATMNRQHSNVYDQVNTLNALVANHDFVDKELSAVISQLLSVFIDNFRRRTFALLTKAYTSLPLSLACSYLALSAEQVIETAQKHSWSYDSSAQILSPAKFPELKSEDGGNSLS
uniref:CSN8/PSMD8/EIF3K domain-containing protein n=1 Tax=Psilocybe cubensis TaxID=181762 RepID=A0A8H8CNR9_PSICU